MWIQVFHGFGGCGPRFSMVFLGWFCPLCCIPSGMDPSQSLPAFPGLSCPGILWEFWLGSSIPRAFDGVPHPARTWGGNFRNSFPKDAEDSLSLGFFRMGNSQTQLFSSWEFQQGAIPKHFSIPAYRADPKFFPESGRELGKSPQAETTSKTFPRPDYPGNFHLWSGVNPSNTSRLFSGKRIPADSKGIP